MNRFNLKNKNIIVTGASSGIGRDCAIEFAKLGANLILLGRNHERLTNVYTEVEKFSHKNSKHLKFSIDLLNDISMINDIVDTCVVKLGKISGFVHAAGFQQTIPVKSLKEIDYLNIFKVNTISGFELAKIVSKRKNISQNSSFVFISSITAIVGRPGLVSYSASKGALISGVKSMALELSSKNIRVNCISPGTILTPMVVKYLDSLSENEKLKRIEGYPLGLGETIDIANLAIFLMSNASKWITAQNFVVDGGYTSK